MRQTAVRHPRGQLTTQEKGVKTMRKKPKSTKIFDAHQRRRVRTQQKSRMLPNTEDLFGRKEQKVVRAQRDFMI